MKNNLWIEKSKRAYAWLLNLYPKEYRFEYGAEMIHVFTDQCRSAFNQQSVFGLFTLWVRTLFDLLITAIYENLTSSNVKLGMLEAVPNVPLPWKGVALVLIPGLLFFVSQIGQLGGTNWFYLVAYRASYFLMIPVLLVWWRARKFPLWGLIPLGLLFNNLLDLGYRLQVRMINPDRTIWKAVLPLLKNIEGTKNLLIGLVFLIFIFLLGGIYIRQNKVSRICFVLLAIYVFISIGQIGLTSYNQVTTVYHVWSWVKFFNRTEFFILSSFWLQDIYLSAGFLLLIAISTLLVSRHGDLAILFPLGYLLALILYGGYQPYYYPEQSTFAIIATIIVIYRLLVALVTPIWIVRSITIGHRRWAIVIPIGIALIVQASLYYIIPLLYEKIYPIQPFEILSSIIDVVLIGIGIALAIFLYRPINIKLPNGGGGANRLVDQAE